MEQQQQQQQYAVENSHKTKRVCASPHGEATMRRGNSETNACPPLGHIVSGIVCVRFQHPFVSAAASSLWRVSLGVFDFRHVAAAVATFPFPFPCSSLPFPFAVCSAFPDVYLMLEFNPFFTNIHTHTHSHTYAQVLHIYYR